MIKEQSTIFTAIKMLFILIVITGIIYPLLVTLIAFLMMPKQAGGNLIKIGEQIKGSKLIAQNFKQEAYFWPRPSAIDYNPIKPSGGSNLGPTSQKLKEEVEKRMQNLGSLAPSELVYTSGSGLDPHISLEAAYFQLNRVAQARSITNQNEVRSLIDSLAEGMYQKYVNVLMLNIALDQQFPLTRISHKPYLNLPNIFVDPSKKHSSAIFSKNMAFVMFLQSHQTSCLNFTRVCEKHGLEHE